MTPIYITKATGEREEFNKQKLIDSLIRSKASPDLAKKIANQLEEKLKEEASTKDIYHEAFSILKKEERPAALRYSLRKAIMDLGPSGFPFEQFVAKIFESKGFQTKTDYIAKGDCVSHEIDVVAWNKEKLIMVEAKFHNELGLKSDLKVALYINSRWEDLENVEFNEFGFKRKLDEGWLITNTKFSESAIRYAKCRKMKLVGWNYPAQGNLQDLIEEAHLHPITCLTSTTPSEEHALMEAGIVLCSQAKENLDIVKQAGLSDKTIADMLDEISLLQN